jgi:hypothetical protein
MNRGLSYRYPEKDTNKISQKEPNRFVSQDIHKICLTQDAQKPLLCLTQEVNVDHICFGSFVTVLGLFVLKETDLHMGLSNSFVSRQPKCIILIAYY